MISNKRIPNPGANNFALRGLRGLVSIAAAGLMFCGMASSASATTVIGTETDGFVGALFVIDYNNITYTYPEYSVASDGEASASFDPYGAGYGTSDGLNFSAVNNNFVWS